MNKRLTTTDNRLVEQGVIFSTKRARLCICMGKACGNYKGYPTPGHYQITDVMFAFWEIYYLSTLLPGRVQNRNLSGH